MDLKLPLIPVGYFFSYCTKSCVSPKGKTPQGYNLPMAKAVFLGGSISKGKVPPNFPHSLVSSHPEVCLPVGIVPLEVPVTGCRDSSVVACLPSMSKALGLCHSTIKQTKMFLLHPDIDTGEMVRKWGDERSYHDPEAFDLTVFYIAPQNYGFFFLLIE